MSTFKETKKDITIKGYTLRKNRFYRAYLISLEPRKKGIIQVRRKESISGIFRGRNLLRLTNFDDIALGKEIEFHRIGCINGSKSYRKTAKTIK